MQNAAFVYCSTALEPAERDSAIYIPARINNRALGLSGTLYRQGSLFIQYLEGPADAVDRVKENILRDPRHGDIHVFSDAVVNRRRFGRWAMGYTLQNETCWRLWAERHGAPAHVRDADTRTVTAFLSHTRFPYEPLKEEERARIREPWLSRLGRLVGGWRTARRVGSGKDLLVEAALGRA